MEIDMKAQHIINKTINAGFGIAALMLMANVAHANANCLNLTGTWQISYKIISAFTDKFVINKVDVNGLVTGISEFGTPMHGICKNGVINLKDDYADFYMASYFIVNSSPLFASHNGTFTSIHTFESYWNPAMVKKINASINTFKALGKNNNISLEADDLKLQKLEELQQLQQTKDH
jgi:hypothetical protein